MINILVTYQTPRHFIKSLDLHFKNTLTDWHVVLHPIFTSSIRSDTLALQHMLKINALKKLLNCSVYYSSRLWFFLLFFYVFYYFCCLQTDYLCMKWMWFKKNLFLFFLMDHQRQYFLSWVFVFSSPFVVHFCDATVLGNEGKIRESWESNFLCEKRGRREENL